MFRYGATLHNYELSTIVVRQFNIKDKKAVGCTISNLNVDLIGLLSAKKNQVTELDAVPETNLNPEISEKQQIIEVEEDIAKELIPERPATITISSKAQNAAADTDPHKTLRQQKQEEKQAEQARELEKLLNLKDI